MVASVGTWLATSQDTTAPPRPEFWANMAGLNESQGLTPPKDLAQAMAWSDAIVVGQVTGVIQGHPLHDYVNRPTHEPQWAVYAQVTVDQVVRVVKGSVQVGDVINVDMDPVHDLAKARAGRPVGMQLFFLINRHERIKNGTADAPLPSDPITWWPVHYRAIIAQRDSGLYSAMDPDAPLGFIASFGAATIDEAAIKAHGPISHGGDPPSPR